MSFFGVCISYFSCNCLEWVKFEGEWRVRVQHNLLGKLWWTIWVAVIILGKASGALALSSLNDMLKWHLGIGFNTFIAPCFPFNPQVLAIKYRFIEVFSYGLSFLNACTWWKTIVYFFVHLARCPGPSTSSVMKLLFHFNLWKLVKL